MKVEKSEATIYELTLSKLEFFTLHKFIGKTSHSARRRVAGLTDKENKVISELYQDMDMGK